MDRYCGRESCIKKDPDPGTLRIILPPSVTVRSVPGASRSEIYISVLKKSPSRHSTSRKRDLFSSRRSAEIISKPPVSFFEKSLPTAIFAPFSRFQQPGKAVEILRSLRYFKAKFPKYFFPVPGNVIEGVFTFRNLKR